ncbi:unnamed protein product [Spirodela intermedia]|uniref:Uncharacterized protein n=1 Tax=Spirodela intermedia TaxID=51605 RepID=A0A7I8K0S5_SPIIN|nr:unnamed protein product [Spirodela intermedia]
MLKASWHGDRGIHNTEEDRTMLEYDDRPKYKFAFLVGDSQLVWQMTEKVNSWILDGDLRGMDSPSKSLSSKASKTSKVFEVRGFFPLPKGEGAFPVPSEVRKVEPP